MSRVLIGIQVQENKILEKERELEVEVIQREHMLQEKLEVLESSLFLLFFLILISNNI